MKTKHFFLAALAASVFATSCTNDTEVMDAPGGQVECTLQVQVPSEIITYAYSDGTTATTLHYAVYEAGSTTPLVTKDVADAFTGLSATVSVKLIKGVTYDFVFFADAPTSPYTFDASARTVTIEGDTFAGNREDMDAFFAIETLTVTDGFNETVELKRPFARVNLGTRDIEEDVVKAIFGEDYSDLKVAMTMPVYTTLSLIDGSVSDKKEVTFGPANIPTGEDFQVPGVEFLAMNYVLVPTELVYSPCKFDIYKGSSVVITVPAKQTIPVRRNFKTNVYGWVLTEDCNLTVTIKPDFDGVLDEFQEVAPGLFKDEDNGVYGVHSPEGFKKLVNDYNLGKGETVELYCDIDLNGESMSALSAFHPENPNTFDGKGHTIKNMAVDDEHLSFIDSWVGPIKNLNIDGVSGEVGTRFVGLFGNVYGDIEDVHIKNVKITSTEGRVGAIVAIHNGGGMKNCSVENVQVTGSWSVGGMIGAINESEKVRVYENLVVKNVKVVNTGGFGGVYDKMTGVLVGNINIGDGLVKFVNCTIEGCDTELPIYNTYSDYYWNGELIKADIE